MPAWEGYEAIIPIADDHEANRELFTALLNK